MNEPGFLGTGAVLSRDLTLVAYILLLVPSMLVGYVFARRKMFVPHHKFMMTGIMLLNWVLIAFVMVVSYRGAVAPEVPERLNEAFYLLPTIHLITGGLAQLLATYLVCRMWFEKVLPQWVMVKNIKLYMRLTLVLWLTTAALGAGIYFLWYVEPAQAGGESGIAPVATEEAISPEATESDATPDATAAAPAATEDISDDDDDNGAAPPAATEEAEADEDDDEVEEPVETEEAEADDADDNDDADEPATTEEANGDDSGQGRGRGRGGDDNDDEPVATEEADDDDAREARELMPAPVSTEEATPTRTPRPSRTMRPAATATRSN
ncbi:MAG: hypothetical protein SF029_04775 [bacterium]|nr:hypothetical protein [bacterium]